MNKRNFLFMLLASICALTFAASSENVTEGKLCYIIWTYPDNPEYNYAIVNKKDGGYQGDIVIPDKIVVDNLEYKVNRIEDYAFFENLQLTSVSIPSSVRSIGDFAFYGCELLTRVSIPGSITNIGDYTFAGSGLTSLILSEGVKYMGTASFAACPLTSVVLPNSLENLGQRAFANCAKLSHINIPSKVMEIPMRAFEFCTSLREVDVPATISDIGEYAFNGCEGLTTLRLHEGLKKIGQYAFGECTSLTDVTIPSTVESMGFFTGGAFDGCSGLTSVTINSSSGFGFSNSKGLKEVRIGEGITAAGGFSGCGQLAMVFLPSTLTELWTQAFLNCTGLETLVCRASVPPTLGMSALYYDIVHKARLYVPVGCKSVYAAADTWKDFKEIIEIGDVNGDQKVDANDVASTVESILNNGEGTLDPLVTDMNGDQKVTIADVTALINTILKK